MKSPVVKRSIVVAGHKTSVSLEEAFWNGMKEISGLRNMTLSELVGEIDSNRQQGNLSSAIRLFVLDYFRTRAMPAAAARIRGRRPRRQARRRRGLIANRRRYDSRARPPLSPRFARISGINAARDGLKDLARLVIGSPSSHLKSSASGPLHAPVRKRDALATPNPTDDIGQRHVALTCASRVRTSYAYRTCRRAGRPQALGGRRSATLEQR